MTSNFDDLTFLHDDNNLGVFNRRKAVGDDEARFTDHHFVHCILNRKFSASIDAGCRFVENQDFWFDNRRAMVINWRWPCEILVPSSLSMKS